MKTLRDVKIGETATVVKHHGEGAVKRRIMDMGITRRTPIYVRKGSWEYCCYTCSHWIKCCCS